MVVVEACKVCSTKCAQNGRSGSIWGAMLSKVWSWIRTVPGLRSSWICPIIGPKSGQIGRFSSIWGPGSRFRVWGSDFQLCSICFDIRFWGRAIFVDFVKNELKPLWAEKLKFRSRIWAFAHFAHFGHNWTCPLLGTKLDHKMDLFQDTINSTQAVITYELVKVAVTKGR